MGTAAGGPCGRADLAAPGERKVLLQPRREADAMIRGVFHFQASQPKRHK